MEDVVIHKKISDSQKNFYIAIFVLQRINNCLKHMNI
uniref:Uncharacterized protein n=1 Tax=viral metagenome TaxID=1070528 RepID=A0A6C0C2C1_9ZZZZ